MKSLILKCLVCLFALLAIGCEYEEVTRETGYKGKARLNPWLAAERFAGERGNEVRSSGSWVKPEWDHDVFFVPVGVLNSVGVVSAMKDWVSYGGHLVLLVEYSEADWNDWSDYQRSVPELQKPLLDFLEETGITLERYGSGKIAGQKVRYDGKSFEVDMDSKARVSTAKDKDKGFVSVEYEYGRVSVVTDARIFRSRKIDEKDHAALLSSIIGTPSTDGEGESSLVVFLRGSGISLWRMLGRHLWPVLVGLSVALLIWLWKSFSRFGPVESAAVASTLRGYDHHLEALGDFQWRLDKCSALLRPIRERIVEAGQRAAVSAGRRDADFFQFLADLAGLPRERVNRALTEDFPSDGTVMTHTAADLQKLLTVLKA